MKQNGEPAAARGIIMHAAVAYLHTVGDSRINLRYIENNLLLVMAIQSLSWNINRAKQTMQREQQCHDTFHRSVNHCVYVILSAILYHSRLVSQKLDLSKLLLTGQTGYLIG